VKAALQALLGGAWLAARAPMLCVTVSILTMVAAAPFALVLGERLKTALGNQPPINLDATEIDPEWWMEFRAQARGLEATFTPTIIGFAAPLDNISALAEGTPRPVVLIVPVALYGLLWAFLWGGVLPRFDRGHRSGVYRFVRDALRHLPCFVLIAAIAALTSFVLYLTVHRLLFGPVYEWLAVRTASERDAFLVRVALYLVFGALVAFVSLVADYARISRAIGGAGGVMTSIAGGQRFVRRHLRAVIFLFVLTGGVLVALLIGYGFVDRRFGGWQGVIVGQAYVVARLVIRLTNAGAQVRLYRSLHGLPIHTSTGPENPGPPAAT